MLAHLKSYPRDLRPVRFNMWSHQGNEKPWSEYSLGWLKDKETETMASEKWPQRLMTSWSPLKMDNSHSDPQFKSDRDQWHRVSAKKNVDEKSLNNPILIEKFSSVKTIWKHTITVKFSVFGGNLSRKSFLVGIGRSLKIAIIRNNLLFCLIPLSSPQFIKRKKYIQKL